MRIIEKRILIIFLMYFLNSPWDFSEKYLYQKIHFASLSFRESIYFYNFPARIQTKDLGFSFE